MSVMEFSPNKSTPVNVKLPLWILFNNSHTFRDVTPQKTPISKKCLGFFSSIGFLLLFISFDHILKKFQLNKNLLFVLLLFPSWLFFTSFPGKDAIFVFSLGLLCFYFIKKHFLDLFTSIILIYLIRQYIAFFIL